MVCVQESAENILMSHCFCLIPGLQGKHSVGTVEWGSTEEQRGATVYQMCVHVYVCLRVLKSLVMTWFAAAVHLLLKTFFYVVPNKARLPSLIGGHLGCGHTG